MHILDTNVVSELVREVPARSVLTHLRGIRSKELCTTAVTEAELRRGLAMMPIGRKSVRLQIDVDVVLDTELGGRILPFDSEAAKVYAVIFAKRSAAGRPISPFDAQIASIVQANRATLLTRNTSHFQNCGFEVINPWK